MKLSKLFEVFTPEYFCFIYTGDSLTYKTICYIPGLPKDMTKPQFEQLISLSVPPEKLEEFKNLFVYIDDPSLITAPQEYDHLEFTSWNSFLLFFGDDDDFED